MEEYVSQNKQNYMGKNSDKTFGKRSKKFVFVLYFCYFLTLTSVYVCVWWWNVSKKDEENIQKIIFLVFSLVFSKWTSWFEELELKKKEHFFHNKLTTNNLIIQSFPMTIFLFEFSNNWCCFELFVTRIFFYNIPEFFKQKSSHEHSNFMHYYFWFCKDERLEKLNPLAILHTVSHTLNK